jgi:hypothetical protein
MVDTCSHCGARIEVGADWCPLCFSKVRTDRWGESNVQRAVSEPLRRPTLRPTSRYRRRAAFGELKEIATRVLLTVGVAVGLAWVAFNLEVQFYAVGLIASVAFVWHVWHRHPA